MYPHICCLYGCLDPLTDYQMFSKLLQSSISCRYGKRTISKLKAQGEMYWWVITRIFTCCSAILGKLLFHLWFIYLFFKQKSKFIDILDGLEKCTWFLKKSDSIKIYNHFYMWINFFVFKVCFWLANTFQKWLIYITIFHHPHSSL